MRERLGKWRPLIGYIGKLETSDWLDWAYSQCVYVVCTVRTVEEVEISSTSSMKAVRRTTQPIAFPARQAPERSRHQKSPGTRKITHQKGQAPEKSWQISSQVVRQTRSHDKRACKKSPDTRNRLVGGSSQGVRIASNASTVFFRSQFLTFSITLRRVDFKTPRNAVSGYVLTISLFHAV